VRAGAAAPDGGGARAPLVVKVGGGAGIDVGPTVADVAALHAEGRRVVLVHGGSDETTRVAEALGHPARFVTSPSGRTSRFTDRRTLEIFEMVYCGKVNKDVVERLQRAGANALGLSGLDGRLLEGRRKATVRSVEAGKVKLLRGDHTGTVERVNVQLLELLLDAGYLPVVTPPGTSEEGVAINVDGDRAAAAIAVALRAEALALLSNVPGLLRDPADPATLVPRVDAADPAEAERWAQGRMKAKLDGAVRAVRGGVGRVVLADAGAARPVAAALAGAGTVVA
jgi:acetylglutamate/LysW-gamma-L-alpha-aminoadipate kinase